MENNVTGAMDRRSLLLLGAALPLAACGGNIIGPPDASQIYILKPPALPRLAGARVDWALAIARPEAPGLLDTNRIAISRSADTGDYFANAVWQDPLTDIVQGALVDGFETSGLIEQVVPDTAGIRTDYQLKVEIRDFEARYAQADSPPTAVVSLAASLINGHDRRLAAHHIFHEESPAGANSIPAAVEAFDRALGAAVKDIVQWATGAVPRGRA